MIKQINERDSDVIRSWEDQIIEYVGRIDEHTFDLAKKLDNFSAEARTPSNFST